MTQPRDRRGRFSSPLLYATRDLILSDLRIGRPSRTIARQYSVHIQTVRRLKKKLQKETSNA